MKIKKDYIKKLDIKMYVNYHTKNNKSIHELNFIDDSDTKEYLINVLTNYSSNSNNPSKFIYGADKMKGFCLNIYDPTKLLIIIDNIWNHTYEYVTIDEETEDWYYDCLKFLWIGNNGITSLTDLRLADLVTEIKNN